MNMSLHERTKLKFKLALAIGIMGLAVPLAPKLAADPYDNCRGCGDQNGRWTDIEGTTCSVYQGATICSNGVCMSSVFACLGGPASGGTSCNCDAAVPQLDGQ
jgi:hypothetical protein